MCFKCKDGKKYFEISAEFFSGNIVNIKMQLEQDGILSNNWINQSINRTLNEQQSQSIIIIDCDEDVDCDGQ